MSSCIVNTVTLVYPRWYRPPMSFKFKIQILSKTKHNCSPMNLVKIWILRYAVKKAAWSFLTLFTCSDVSFLALFTLTIKGVGTSKGDFKIFKSHDDDNLKTIVVGFQLNAQQANKRKSGQYFSTPSRRLGTVECRRYTSSLNRRCGIQLCWLNSRFCSWPVSTSLPHFSHSRGHFIVALTPPMRILLTPHYRNVCIKLLSGFIRLTNFPISIYRG